MEVWLSAFGGITIYPAHIARRFSTERDSKKENIRWFHKASLMILESRGEWVHETSWSRKTILYRASTRVSSSSVKPGISGSLYIRIVRFPL